MTKSDANNSLKEIRTFLERKKGVLAEWKQQNRAKEKANHLLQNDYLLHEKALAIIKEVGKKTQTQLQYHVSDITSLALDAVFPEDPYTLTMSFVDRRDKNECDLRFERNGVQLKPIDSSGVGAVDVASFALRIAAWSIQFPKTRNTIILDEPFKFLQKTKHDKASEMIKELSDKLGIQFIIVTHEEKLAAAADRVFKVSIKNRISKIEQE